MQNMKMIAQKMYPLQAVKYWPFFAFSANPRDNEKQNFAQRDFECSPFGFYNT